MKMTDLQIRALCPNDDPEDPAFPNHTDSDIWVAGFRACLDHLKMKKKASLQCVDRRCSNCKHYLDDFNCDTCSPSLDKWKVNKKKLKKK